MIKQEEINFFIDVVLRLKDVIQLAPEEFENLVFPDTIEKPTAMEDSEAEALVGKGIKVYWSQDNTYHYGKIKKFNRGSRKHVVLYDDGDEESLYLPNEKYSLDKNIEIVGIYGKGSNALVLKVKKGDKFFAVKLSGVSIDREKTLREYNIQKIFAEYNMAPRISDIQIMDYEYKKIRVHFVRALMDPIYTTVYNYLREGRDAGKLIEPMKCLIQKKYLLEYPKPYLHSDMHVANIAILKDKKTLGFIDFGMTVHAPPFMQILDCIPLITSLKLSGVSRAFLELLIDAYNQIFRIKLDVNKFEDYLITIKDGSNRKIPIGYQYRSDGIVLHSYSWPAEGEKVPLPNKDQIETVFPTIRLPRVR
jgi:hypothetical protein